MSRVALITGSNQGIGYFIAKKLLQHSIQSLDKRLHVIMAARNLDAVMSSRQAILDETKADENLLSTVELDLENPQTIEQAANHVNAQHGGLDILVCNAGMAFKGDAFDEHVARQTLGTNYFGTLENIQRFLPLLRDNGRLVIVASRVGSFTSLRDDLRREFSSPSLTLDRLNELMNKFIDDVRQNRYAEEGWPQSCYGVSKAGLLALTPILARQLKDRKILVNATCPGWCRTSMAGQRAPRSAEEGAEVEVQCALLPADESADEQTGMFWFDGQSHAIVTSQ